MGKGGSNRSEGRALCEKKEEGYGWERSKG